jgi:hypothetical protein
LNFNEVAWMEQQFYVSGLNSATNTAYSWWISIDRECMELWCTSALMCIPVNSLIRMQSVLNFDFLWEAAIAEKVSIRIWLFGKTFI